VLRLRQIAIVAHELEPVVQSLGASFGLEVAFRDPAVETFGLHNAVLPVGNQFVEIVSPIRDGTAGGRYLERRKGDGGYMVILQSDHHGDRTRRVEELGIRTALRHDGREYKIMQLHPADTGGSFLEIDEQIGGDDLDGPWEPAGADWQRARRTDVVTGIAAAEIQSPDPQRLAARWSEILEVGLEQADGVATIQLDNATLRFVEATDGRGEGLGGIDLIATTPPGSVETASARGDGRIDPPPIIGGLRVSLV
jgi:hypothetical protein